MDRVTQIRVAQIALLARLHLVARRQTTYSAAMPSDLDAGEHACFEHAAHEDLAGHSGGLTPTSARMQSVPLEVVR